MTIMSLIITAALAQGVDPVLAVAIAKTESNLNPNAVGSLGERSVFQLRPEYHDVRPGFTAHNVSIALQYLKQVQAKCKHALDNTWVICYNLGIKGGSRIRHPKDFSYYRQVMHNYAILSRSSEVLRETYSFSQARGWDVLDSASNWGQGPIRR